MRVFVIGAAGMLGSAFHNYFMKNNIEAKEYDINLTDPYINYLDIRNYYDLCNEVDNFNPDLIINLAALTDLEFCEKNSENCYATNYHGTENLAILSSRYDVPYIYISTAGVFDGVKDSYSCFDKPNPINLYGHSKYLGELAVQSLCDKFFIFRAGWMMGGGLGKNGKDKKFLKKIFNQIQSGEKTLYVVDDKYGTPTYTEDFAKNVMRVFKTQRYGLYNQTNTGFGSRLDVAQYFLECLGIEKKIKIKKVNSDYFSKDFFANRPESEKLINFNLRQIDLEMPNWKNSLHEYVCSEDIKI